MNPPRAEKACPDGLITKESVVAALKENCSPLAAAAALLHREPPPSPEQVLPHPDACLTPFADTFARVARGPAVIFSQGHPDLQAHKAAAFKDKAPSVNWLPDLIALNKTSLLPPLLERINQHPRIIIVEDKISQIAHLLSTLTHSSANFPSESQISQASSAKFRQICPTWRRLCQQAAALDQRPQIIYHPPDKTPVNSGWGPITTSLEYPSRVDTLLAIALNALSTACFGRFSNYGRLFFQGGQDEALSALNDPDCLKICDLDGPFISQQLVVRQLTEQINGFRSNQPPPFSRLAA